MHDPTHRHARPRRSWRTSPVRRHAFPVLAVLAGLPCLLGATVWRSVSADGVVTYSQSQPSGVAAEPVVLADSPADTPSGDVSDDDAENASGTASGNPTLTAEQQAALEGLRAAEQARQDEARKLRLANCSRARDVLTRLTANGRIRVRDADGAERAMTEAERTERIAAAQTAVASHCVD